MKFTLAAAALAAVTGVNAWAHNVTVTTEVVNSYTTFCPYATQITHGSHTYTVTAPTTLTITDCPCTLTKPVIPTSSVVCETCAPVVTTPVVAPTTPVVAGTSPVVTPGVSGTAAAPSTVPTAGAGKAAALSGAGLAGIVGLAAFVL